MTALGYFITFSTYGSWLHGSEKTSVDRKRNAFGEAFVETNAALMEYRQGMMVDPPFILHESDRKIVINAIIEITAFRSWFLWAAQVRTNHVHIVLGIGDGLKSPERMMTEIKGRASRMLNGESKHWTRHGSTRHLHTEDTLNRAIYYTLHEQGEQMEVYEAPRA